MSNDQTGQARVVRLPQREIPPPTGEVTLAFTDVQGSTNLWEADPEAMTDALRLHDALIRDLITRHRGYEVKTEGDAFMVAFGDPLAATRWALDVQSALFDADWDDDVLALRPARVEDAVFRGLRVRIGLHLGEPECRPDPITGRMDYFGTIVNRAARVGSCGHGGQVVVSAPLWERVRGELAERVAWQELGDHLLKGLKTTTGIVQVLPEALAARTFPPLKSVAAEGERPFRGLQSFGPGDGKLFFGREEEIRSLCAAVRGHPIVTVTGSSGAGKTSLLHAGLPPNVPEYEAVSLRPGPDPLSALRAALERVVPDWARLAAITNLLQTDVPRFGAALVRLARERDRGLLILVDQAEELLTLARDKADRDRFVLGLLAATEDAAAPVRLVLSVREDFFGRLALIEPLRGRYARRVEVLARPGPDQLVEALVRPAELFGYRFEDPELPREMVEPIADEPAALAMLQVCADRMWDARDQGRRVLTRGAYVDVGGIEGALAAHADAVLDGLDGVRRTEARRLLLRLVTTEGTREPCDRADLLDAARDPEMSADVLDLLVAERLLTAREADDGSATVEIVHEALVRHWDRLVGWLAEDREGHVLHNALRQAVADWIRRGRSPDALWRGELLWDLRRWQDRSSPELTFFELEFVATSIRHGERRRRSVRRAIGGAVAVLLATTAWAIWEWRDAEYERALAQAAQAEAAAAAHESRIRALISGAQAADARGFPERAVQLAREVFGLDPERARSTLYTALGAPDELAWGIGHTARLQSVAWDAAGERVVTASADGTARTWSRGLHPEHVLPHFELVDGAKFLPEGRVVSWDHDGEVRVWERDGALRSVNMSHAGAPLSGAMGSQDGSILTWGLSGLLVRQDLDGAELAVNRTSLSGYPIDVVELADGRLIVTDLDRALFVLGPDLTGLWGETDFSAGIDNVAVSPQGHVAVGQETLALFSPTGERLWDVATDREFGSLSWNDAGDRLLAQRALGCSVVFDLDGNMVHVGISGDFRRAVWAADFDTYFSYGDEVQVSIGGLSRDPQLAYGGARAPVAEVAVRPGGTELAVASHDGVLRLYPGIPAGHRATWAHEAPLTAAVWSPDETAIATLGADGAVGIWASHLERRLAHPDADAAGRGSWSPDSRFFAVGSQHGAVFVFDASGVQIQTLAGHGAAVTRLKWSPSGDRFASADLDGAVILWSSATWTELGRLRGHTGSVFALDWSPDGQRVATGSRDTAVGVWTAEGELVGGLNAHTEGVGVVAWDPSGELLASAGGDEVVRVHRDGKTVRGMSGHTDVVFLLEWSPDGALLASAGFDGTVRLWPRDGGEAAILEGHDAELNDIAWSPDGTMLASSAEDYTIRLWTRAGEPFAAIHLKDEPTTVQWSRDGRELLTGDGAVLRKLYVTDEAALRLADQLAPARLTSAEIDRMLDLR